MFYVRYRQHNFGDKWIQLGWDDPQREYYKVNHVYKNMGTFRGMKISSLEVEHELYHPEVVLEIGNGKYEFHEIN